MGPLPWCERVLLSCLIGVYPKARGLLGGYAWFWTFFRGFECVMAVSNLEAHAFNNTTFSKKN